MYPGGENCWSWTIARMRGYQDAGHTPSCPCHSASPVPQGNPSGGVTANDPWYSLGGDNNCLWHGWCKNGMGGVGSSLNWCLARGGPTGYQGGQPCGFYGGHSDSDWMRWWVFRVVESFPPATAMVVMVVVMCVLHRARARAWTTCVQWNHSKLGIAEKLLSQQEDDSWVVLMHDAETKMNETWRKWCLLSTWTGYLS